MSQKTLVEVVTRQSSANIAVAFLCSMFLHHLTCAFFFSKKRCKKCQLKILLIAHFVSGFFSLSFFSLLIFELNVCLFVVISFLSGKGSIFSQKK